MRTFSKNVHITNEGYFWESFDFCVWNHSGAGEGKGGYLLKETAFWLNAVGWEPVFALFFMILENSHRQNQGLIFIAN